LDAVISHEATGRPDCVTVDDVGLSDHHLLHWEVSTVVTVSSRPWYHFNVDFLRSAISSSVLCQPDAWPTDIDKMAQLYDDELNR